MERASDSGLSAEAALELESTIGAVGDEQNANITMNENYNGIENGNQNETGVLSSTEDSVSIYLEDGNDMTDFNDPQPDYYLPQPDVKLINAYAYFSSHDRQIQRLQEDEQRRKQEYNLMRLKLDRHYRDSQQEIIQIRNEVFTSEERLSAQIEAMNSRLSQCEQQHIERSVSVDSEFNAVKDVLSQVCTSVVALQEQEGVAQPPRQQQPQSQEVIITHGLAGSSSANLPSTSEMSPDRVICSQCGGNFSKRYVRRHQRLHCKNRPRPTQARAQDGPPVLVSQVGNSSTVAHDNTN